MKFLTVLLLMFLTGCAGTRPTIYIGPATKSVSPKIIQCHQSGSYIHCQEI